LDSLYTTTYTHSIPNNRITGYRISRFLVGCNITIVGEGFQNIVAVGYTGSDADNIEELIKKIIR
jgi:superfamily I DNA/RNA helicase